MTVLSSSGLSEPRVARRQGAVILLLGPLALVLVSFALGQDANWDLRNYQWYAGYALLEGRLGFDMVPAQTPTFYNPLLDVPLYLLGSTLPAWAAFGLISLVQALGFVLLYGLAFAVLDLERPLARVWASAAIALTGMLGGGGLALLGSTFWDNLLGLFVMAGLLVVVQGRAVIFFGPWGRAFALAALSGLPVGAAMGLKQPAVIYCVGLCFAFLAMPVHPLRRLLLSFFSGLGILAGIAVTGGYWMWLLWETYGNPLHPYFNHIFQSPDAALRDYRDANFANMSPTLLDRVLLPGRMVLSPWLVGETFWFYLRALALYVFAPLAGLAALFGWAARDPLGDRLAGRYILWALMLAFALWLAMFCIYRYLVPLEMLAPLGIVIAVGLLPLARKWRWTLALAVLAFVQVTTVPGNWGRIAWTDRVVEVSVPPIEDPAETMVLMAGFAPTSYVIPSFPPEIPFVRIHSNFVTHDATDNGYLDRLRARVAAHRGDFFMLSTIPDMGVAREAAAAHGLRLEDGDCRLVTSNLGEALSFCRVQRPG